ncbi:MAG TPA: ATP-binding protein [bacterium]|nr:ATP-binding protein [bacterium]HNZ73431.1 ATP-binding protein [bacterium]HOH66873.1 ATP-binding protein [bacterium]HPN81318.1 ATP-binding protein [bacterium]HPW39561.1 ATP-binding protein [bacterium]
MQKKNSIEKIVLTGGPCAGKSTCLQAIKERYDDVLVVPEVATILLSGGFPVPGRDLPWSADWQSAFQAAVAKTQQSLEQAYELVAQNCGARLLVCDRGLLDGAAYTPGGTAEFCRLYQVDQAQTQQQYAKVLHLESLATARPELYGKTGNQNRFESLDEAQALEGRTRAAWSDHPGWTFIPGNAGIEAVKSQVLAAIDSLLVSAAA